jgi:hypothetical protein
VGEQHFDLEVGDHAYRLSVDASGWRHQFRVYRDGAPALERTTNDQRLSLLLETGERIDVRLNALGRVRRATLVSDDVELDMDAEPGSRAARRQAAQREHPARYASLHVLEGVGAVLLTVLGIGAIIQYLLRPLLGLLPSVDLPSLPLPDLPDVPWPDIPWPDLPSFELPGRLQALLDSLPYWLPIVIGIGAMIYEIRRQKRQREARARRVEAESPEAESPAAPSPGPPELPGAAELSGDPDPRDAQR